MASLSQEPVSRRFNGVTWRNELLDKYFYFCMTLLFAAIVVTGFSLHSE